MAVTADGWCGERSGLENSEVLLVGARTWRVGDGEWQQWVTERKDSLCVGVFFTASRLSTNTTSVRGRPGNRL